MAYVCCVVAIILRQIQKVTESPYLPLWTKKSFRTEVCFWKAKGKAKSNHSPISSIKDKRIATYADVTRLLLMFENLRLTSAKKRCEWECNKTIISENFCVFPFVKTSGYRLKVFIFKLNQIHIFQTTIVEKHLRWYYVRMNSKSKSK